MTFGFNDSSVFPGTSFRAAKARRKASRSPARNGGGPLLESLERREFMSAVVSSDSPLTLAGPSTVTVAALSPTTTRVDASAEATVFGQGVTFTAFVSGGGTGTVSFFNGTTLLGTAPLGANGQAKFWTPSLAVGSHSITASYAGDATRAPSASGAVTQSVSRATGMVDVGSSAGVVQNPILRPDRVVVVVLENGASNAIGDTANMPYLNELASSGLVYNNTHGLNGSGQIFGQMNYLALYSGSTQGITDDFAGYSFGAPNLARSLHDKGLSFTGYAESLPAAGDMTTMFAPDAPGSVHTDAYARRYNPMAQFTNVGAGKTGFDVNKPFTDFPSDFSGLSDVSYVIPNRLHNTHGSNVAPPYANDPTEYDRLRRDADAWLEQNLDAYVEWAKANNSLLIVTTEDADRTRNYAQGGTTIVTGDPRLFVAGTNESYVTPYHVLRTIEDMFGLAPIGDTVTADRFDTDPLGRLSPAGPTSDVLVTGQPVTYTATVSPLAPATGTPSGSVQFLLDGANYGGPITLVNGSASISVPGLAAGSHRISAVYSGSNSVTIGSAALTQPVSQSSTSVGLSSSAPRAEAAQPVSFTATVSFAPGSGVPIGLVTFRDGPTVLGTASLDNQGRATLSTASLGTGTHRITAIYGGDANHAGSESSELTQVINPIATSVGLTSSAAAAQAGQPVTFTATVSSTGPIATGLVTFKNGATVLGTATLDAAGRATLTTSSLAVGTHSITATYGGDPSHGVSTSSAVSQLIQLAASTVSLSSSNLSAKAGESVTFTAKVPTTSGGLQPTGVVTFRNGSAVLGTATLNAAGEATLSTGALTTGTHPIIAAYSGDVNFAASTSAAINQVVTTPIPTPTGPANDKFADRITLSGALATATGSNVGATKEAGEPKHGANGGGKSIWYSWTAPTTGLVSIDTLGSNFKTVLGVYTGTALTNLKKVVGVGTNIGNAGVFGFVAKAGTTYQIAVDGANSATGTANLRLKAWDVKQTPKDWKNVWDDVKRDDGGRNDDHQDKKTKGKKSRKGD